MSLESFAITIAICLAAGAGYFLGSIRHKGKTRDTPRGDPETMPPTAVPRYLDCRQLAMMGAGLLTEFTRSPPDELLMPLTVSTETCRQLQRFLVQLPTEPQTRGQAWLEVFVRDWVQEILRATPFLAAYGPPTETWGAVKLSVFSIDLCIRADLAEIGRTVDSPVLLEPANPGCKTRGTDWRDIHEVAPVREVVAQRLKQTDNPGEMVIDVISTGIIDSSGVGAASILATYNPAEWRRM
ncbi:MAG: hypothetical protein O7E57_05505 [Gammaproteobacteria bacterium]|nr:hypothetical protein [Gammaproteobacteria bacterium]